LELLAKNFVGFFPARMELPEGNFPARGYSCEKNFSRSCFPWWESQISQHYAKTIRN